MSQEYKMVKRDGLTINLAVYFASRCDAQRRIHLETADKFYRVVTQAFVVVGVAVVGEWTNMPYILKAVSHLRLSRSLPRLQRNPALNRHHRHLRYHHQRLPVPRPCPGHLPRTPMAARSLHPTLGGCGRHIAPRPVLGIGPSYRGLTAVHTDRYAPTHGGVCVHLHREPCVDFHLHELEAGDDTARDEWEHAKHPPGAGVLEHFCSPLVKRSTLLLVRTRPFHSLRPQLSFPFLSFPLASTLNLNLNPLYVTYQPIRIQHDRRRRHRQPHLHHHAGLERPAPLHAHHRERRPRERHGVPDLPAAPVQHPVRVHEYHPSGHHASLIVP
jgi:hypothetical protein